MLLNCSSYGHEDEKGKGREPRFSFSGRPPCSTSIELGTSSSGSTASEQRHARDQDLHTQHSDDSFPSIVSAIQAAAATEEMMEEGMRLEVMGRGFLTTMASSLYSKSQIQDISGPHSCCIVHWFAKHSSKPKLSKPAC